MKRAVAAFALALGACGGDGIVDLTIGVDPAVPDAELMLVRSLTLDVTGLETMTVSDPLAQPFATNREERLVVRSPAGGLVTLAITARDAGGAALLFGQVSLTLSPGSEMRQTVILSAVGTPLDGGGDLAPLDLAGADQLGLDAPSPDLAPQGCPAGVLLCDGFESGALDALRWNSIDSPAGGTIALDNTRAHRGQWSLHAHLNPVASGAIATAEIGESHTFTPAGSSFFVRAWYYFPSAAAGISTTLIDSGQSAPPYLSLSLASDHDALSIYDSFVSPSVYTASTTPKIPLDTWTCLEWQVDGGTPNQVHAWIDGVKVSQLDLMEATRGTPEIGVIYFGLAMYPPNTSTIAVDAWVDDIIFDHSAIGCAK